MTNDSFYDSNAKLKVLWWKSLVTIFTMVFVYNLFQRWTGTWDTTWDLLVFTGFLAGQALRYWAKFTLGRYFTYQLGVRADHKLVSAGPYALLRLRHPGYTGMFISAIFLCRLVTASPLLVIAFSAASILLFLIWRIPEEEAMMTREFGQEWEAHKVKHPWRVIPFVW